MLFLKIARVIALQFGIAVLVLAPSSMASADTLIEQMNAQSHIIDVKRKSLEDSIEKKQCPDGVMTKQTTPEFKDVCVTSCQGLGDSAFKECYKAFWACHDTYDAILKTVARYNKYLDDTCSTAAKDRAAEDAANAIKARAKQLDENRTKELR